MKRLLIVLIFLVLVSPLFAQTISEPNRSDTYYVNLTIERVIPTGQGYIIQYRTGTHGIATVGIPNEWFTDAASRAELIQLPRGRNWPSMSLFFKEGQFSHIRLYVHRAKGHETWGSIPQATDLSRFFLDADNFNFQF